MNVGELDLTAEEATAPNALPAKSTGTLWTQTGWVRGTWPASVVMSDPSGVCSSAMYFGGQVQRPLVDQTPNRHTFVQCSQSYLPVSFGTAAVPGSSGLGVGTAQLTLLASNAAGNVADPTKMIQLDNTTPTVALSGPTDAPAPAGAQYVTATAGGSPSGIEDIVCTVDGGAAKIFHSTTAQVPVDGIGQHTVNCYAENNAVDPAGVHGRSQPASWTLKIGQPTLVGIAFQRFVGGLHCASRRIRVRIPGHWVTVHRHGIPVWVRTRARTVLRRIVRCHPQTALRRTVVFTRVRRNGRLVTVRRVKLVRVVVPPRTLSQTARRVNFGRATTVSGWLGTSGGTGLGGHAVSVIAAPDDGRGEFAVVSHVLTAPDGSWSARLAPGPSRVVEARYDGDAMTEGASSSAVHVVVPAQIHLLSVRPSHIRWGGTVRITGELIGGYLPPSGALVRLRIGIGRSFQTYGVERVTGGGRFTTTYTFGLGDPSVQRTYFFQVATLPEGDYPFAPGSSARRLVTVGGPS